MSTPINGDGDIAALQCAAPAESDDAAGADPRELRRTEGQGALPRRLRPAYGCGTFLNYRDPPRSYGTSVSYGESLRTPHPLLGVVNDCYELTIVRLTIVSPNDCKPLRFLNDGSLTIVAPYDC